MISRVFTGLVIATMALVNSGMGQSRIQITVEDMEDSIAYLGYHLGDKRYVADTVPVMNRVVVFTHETGYQPGLYFLYTPSVYFEFIVNEPTIELTTSGPDYIQNMIVVTSEENTAFVDMQKYVSSRRQAFEAIASELDSAETDSLVISENIERRKRIDKEVQEYQLNLARTMEGSFVSRMMYMMQKPKVPEGLQGAERYNYYKSHFFDNISISDGGMLRTPLYAQKVTEYLDKVVLQDPDSVIAAVDHLLSKSRDNEEAFRYLLVTLSTKYESSPIMGHDKVFVHIVEAYYLEGDADWMGEDILTKLRSRIATIKPNLIGNPAPPLILNDTLYGRVSLYEDIRADYTVLYFYDPDCGHCKKKTPVLYDAYTNLRSENVQVLAINIANNTERWKEYIRDNGLDWINLADSDNKTNFRYFYDVRSTPTLFILDSKKQIIAKKLDASQVEEFIANHRRRSPAGG